MDLMGKTFIFNIEWKEALSGCPDDVRLEVYDAVIEYAESGKLTSLRPMAAMAFNFIKRELDFEFHKCKEIKAKRSLAGKKGMAKRYNKRITNDNKGITKPNKQQQNLTNLTNVRCVNEETENQVVTKGEICDNDVSLKNGVPNTDTSEITNTNSIEDTSSLDISLKEKENNKEKESDDFSFDVFWDMYDKKTGSKDKIKRKWDKLSKKDKQAILLYVPHYKEAQPDKRYRKNPETFLNNKSWNDELIYANRHNDVSKFYEKEEMEYSATID